ncbi:hypothetical protein X771_02265 [Mesorhizobium sp. LSJC277A00]|nr:hypothetical protein X771_02265 [Mesorhizobium sp. LSJC277A00]
MLGNVFRDLLFICEPKTESGSQEIADSAEMARPKRFELLTPRFVVWCSIISLSSTADLEASETLPSYLKHGNIA